MDERELTQLFYRARETPQTITETERKRLKRAYTGTVQHFDRRLSSFLDTLQTRLDDPIVCLTSDHGELFGKNGSYFHPGDLHPELLRVPLVVSPSADIQPTSDPVSTVDILPTLAAVAGSDDVSGVDGRNLQRHVGDRTVFASVNDSVRVVTNECTAAYHIDQIPEEHLSEWGPEQIQSSDDMDQFDDEDLQERLEALGYR
jgi:arylsulfatase A-like enzyme